MKRRFVNTRSFKTILSHFLAVIFGCVIGWYIPISIKQVHKMAKIQYLEKECRQQTASENSWLLLGSAKVDNADILGATKAFQKALTINTNSIIACQRIAECYLVRNDFCQAKQWFQRAIDIAEATDPTAIYQAKQLLSYVDYCRTNIINRE